MAIRGGKMSNRELFEQEAQKVMEWMWAERKKMDKKFKDSDGLDTNAARYNKLDKETLDKLNKLKEKYGIK
jgi:hypothetical protein